LSILPHSPAPRSPDLPRDFPRPDAGWPALSLVSVLAGQQSGTPNPLASWPGNSGRRRKWLEDEEFALQPHRARDLANWPGAGHRSEEHTSELQSIAYN